MKTIGFGRSKNEKVDCIALLHENLRKPLILEGRRVKKVDCIAFVFEPMKTIGFERSKSEKA